MIFLSEAFYKITSERWAPWLRRKQSSSKKSWSSLIMQIEIRYIVGSRTPTKQIFSCSIIHHSQSLCQALEIHTSYLQLDPCIQGTPRHLNKYFCIKYLIAEVCEQCQGGTWMKESLERIVGESFIKEVTLSQIPQKS